MKNAIFNIFTKVSTFIKAHAAILIITDAVVLTTAVATPVAVHVLKENPIDKPYTESSIPELDKKLEEQEEGLPSQAEQELTEHQKNDEIPSDSKTEVEKNDASIEEKPEPKPEQKPIVEAPSKQETPKENTPTTNTPTTSTNNNPTNKDENKNAKNNAGVTQTEVVQTANTETGISWDGKSPIIYTYPDGSNGTTPKDGATYEVVPGFIGTYTAPKIETDNVVVGVCSHCGKNEGDGAHGTCLRYWGGGDHDCPNCGVLVPVNTCHTCS